ncbi:uncharacterized protein LOC110274831 [Arachis duranensis]|uniref:Uncharacterized protein LOC110274831 n=1 Tax=Arachis duranensis TaxID=130453 RepID=A0A6P5MMQ3_ARADU|nr:uncharacterized protein LOC110274831 [Arachis duranensis]
MAMQKKQKGNTKKDRSNLKGYDERSDKCINQQGKAEKKQQSSGHATHPHPLTSPSTASRWPSATSATPPGSHISTSTTPTPNAAATSTASSASLTNSKSISATTASSLPTPPTLALNTFLDDKAWKRGACTSTSSENHSPESASA